MAEGDKFERRDVLGPDGKPTGRYEWVNVSKQKPARGRKKKEPVPVPEPVPEPVPVPE